MSDKIEPRELSPEQWALVKDFDEAMPGFIVCQDETGHVPIYVFLEDVLAHIAFLEAERAASLPGHLARELCREVETIFGGYNPETTDEALKAALDAAEAHLAGKEKDDDAST